jgi:hypothetical protein
MTHELWSQKHALKRGTRGKPWVFLYVIFLDYVDPMYTVVHRVNLFRCHILQYRYTPKMWLLYTYHNIPSALWLLKLTLHRVHTECQWLLFGVHSIMMVKTAQPVEGRGHAERADTLLLFLHYPYMYSVVDIHTHTQHHHTYTHTDPHNDNLGTFDH